MGWKFEIHAVTQVAAAADRVWERVSDHEGTPTWVTRGLQKVTVIQPGDPEPGGVGALRSVKFVGWPAVTEEVVAFEAGRRFSYSLRSGMPHVSDHLGTVSVAPTSDTACVLRWDIQFEFRPWHPLSWSAPLFVAGFGRVVQSGCDELGRQLGP